jgi:S-adenosylmethionine hydrolase
MAKTTLMSYAPGSVLVDISHHVPLHGLRQAAFLLVSSCRHFPLGSVHIVLVGVFTDEQPRMLLAQKDGHFFIAPDNGILSLAFGSEPFDSWLCHEFNKPFIFREWIVHAGLAISEMHKGGKLPFMPCIVNKSPGILQPGIMPYGVECNILCIDHYENVVLGINKEQFDIIFKNRPFKIQIARMKDITAICHNYNDVPVGAPLCRFDNAGFLEIAVNTNELRYRTIRIFFNSNH